MERNVSVFKCSEKEKLLFCEKDPQTIFQQEHLMDVNTYYTSTHLLLTFGRVSEHVRFAELSACTSLIPSTTTTTTS